MADDKEDDAANIITRQKILSLQAEHSRKTEQLDRLKEKKKALNDELKQRGEARDSMKSEIDLERVKHKDDAQNRHAGNAEDEAVDLHVAAEMKVILARQVPAFKADENQEDDSDGENQDGDGEAQEEQKKIHDSVIVTYLAPRASEVDKLDEYRVTYRIDKVITGTQLHTDACEFWGCSKDEFRLCQLEEIETSIATNKKLELRPIPEEMMGEPQKKAGQDDVEGKKLYELLDIKKRANLFLVHQKVLESKELQKTAPSGTFDIEEVIKKWTRSEVDDSSLATMKQGANAEAQQEQDHYAVAFSKWPGIHNLLKSAPRYATIKNWHRIHFRDFVVYLLLMLLTGLLIGQRFPTEYYWLRQGIVTSIGKGMPGETSSAIDGVVNMLEVNEYDDMWRWIRGSFHYQLFNGNSTLHDYYQPIGFLRVRQQKAKIRDCRRPEITEEVRGGPCHYLETQSGQQDKRSLIIKGEFWLNTSTDPADTGRMAIPDPLHWSQKEAFDASLSGHMQDNYDGSGLMVDYNLSNPNAGITFQRDMEVFRTFWLNRDSRLLTLEVLLGNYNMGGFVSSVFMFEISASGAVKATPHLNPLNFGDDIGGGSGAMICDAIRGILVLYIALVQAASESNFKALVGQSGLNYIFSFTGFIDLTTVAVYAAMGFMRLKHSPPNPNDMQMFYSYSVEAVVHERLFATEGVFILLVAVRLTTFMKLNQHVERYWKMVFRATRMISFWLWIIVPPFIGAVMFAHCVWSPYSQIFSTWWHTVVSLVFFIKQDLPLADLFKANPTWTIPFISYFYIIMILFLMPGFLAITVYAHMEVRLLDMEPTEKRPWSRDQWMDWLLFGPVYKLITGRKPGSSKKEGGEDEDEDGEGDGEDDDDDDDA